VIRSSHNPITSRRMRWPRSWGWGGRRGSHVTLCRRTRSAIEAPPSRPGPLNLYYASREVGTCPSCWAEYTRSLLAISANGPVVQTARARAGGDSERMPSSYWPARFLICPRYVLRAAPCRQERHMLQVASSCLSLLTGNIASLEAPAVLCSSVGRACNASH
jgi:hypothetical protein